MGKEGIPPLRREKRRKKTRTLVYVVIVAFAVVCLFTYFLLQSSNQPTNNDNWIEPFVKKAAIVDHLSISQPNKVFWLTSKDTLEKAGFEVDYYPGNNVTVEFYRSISFYSYSLIVFRVHSTAQSPEGTSPEKVVFFTSEPYSTTKHVNEQLNGQVVVVKMYEGASPYFGITPLFVKNAMKWPFKNATIIAMGCDGLKHNSMAAAFIEKGAKAYISWTDLVSASHTDKATKRLLKCLVTENQSIKDSVEAVMTEVGPDPEYGSQLEFYPTEAGNLYITPVTNNMPTQTHEPTTISITQQELLHDSLVWPCVLEAERILNRFFPHTPPNQSTKRVHTTVP